MNLMPTHEQVSIFDTANQVFSELYPLSRFRREADAATAIAERRRLGALGLLGICVPEAEGGTGLTLVEQAIVCQAMGRTCAPLTLVPTMLASEIATARGDARLASALMRGDEAAGILLPATLDGRSDETDPRWTAYGANGAGCFLSVAPGAASLVSVGNLAAPAWRDCLTSDLRMATDVRVPQEAASAVGGQSFVRGVVLLAAVLVGLAETALEMAVAHAKTRIQFGAPIGVNQAVRHPCADIAVRCQVARSQLLHAALAVESRDPRAEQLAAYAKVLASDVAKASCANNIQLHGGIGLTDEFAAHILLKQTHTAERWFGPPEYHLQFIMQDRTTKNSILETVRHL